jgi:hypothetical protein
MFNEKIYGFTRGIVIKNNDPDMRGRVKIFIPAYPALILNNSYNLTKPGINVNPTYNSYNITPETTSYLKKLKNSSPAIFPKAIMDEIAEIVPWADQASPLMGTGGMGLYDAKSDQYFATDVAPTSANATTPAAAAAKQRAAITDPKVGASGSADTHIKLGTPGGQKNAARGSFSIPKVGAHVWVFFEDGNIERPIYFAYSYNNNEWESVLNESERAPSVNNPTRLPVESDAKSPKLYAGKYTLTERGGTIEIINTQNFEAVKITDFHGNTYQLTNHGIFENTANGKKKSSHITGDYFLKVDGRYKLEVSGDMEIVSKGTKHHIVGNLEDKKWQDDWKNTAKDNFKNAAAFKKAPDFTKLKENMVKSAEKKAPNDFFCLPKFLDFKLPFGIPYTLWLQQLNTVLFNLKDIIDMGLTVIKDVQELSDDLLKILRNPFSFLLNLLGDSIKLMGISLCNDKTKK